MMQTKASAIFSLVTIAVVSASYIGHNPTTTTISPYQPTTPGHIVIDGCTCFEKGNYYSPVSSDDCRSFTQRTAFLPAETLKCPYGLQFDVQTCVCNYPKYTVCPQYCPAPYTPTPNPGRKYIEIIYQHFLF
ncbi:hypothetical protein EB796_000084 [Bugula neritina]|uniref:Chitin-binding type-2 domain-containing protein n=1 Tax=Bugula neritina TaxID=10212 RepID=A0A7J7KTP9_BUGNE|nr:hypothetical protein EB796_000084 [Bugula neritina]